MTRFTDQLYEKADEIESERAEIDSNVDEGDHWESTSGYRDDVDEMFQSLRDELES